MDAPASPSGSAASSSDEWWRLGLVPPVSELEAELGSDPEELPAVTSGVPAWRDLLGNFSEFPVILGGNSSLNFYELKPMLEYVYFWQLTGGEIDNLLRDKSVTERHEVVMGKMDGIDKPIVCIDPAILPRICNRTDRRLGLMPSVARTSRALAIRDAIAEDRQVIVVPAFKSACQKSYERRMAKRASA